MLLQQFQPQDSWIQAIAQLRHLPVWGQEGACSAGEKFFWNVIISPCLLA